MCTARVKFSCLRLTSKNRTLWVSSLRSFATQRSRRPRRYRRGKEQRRSSRRIRKKRVIARSDATACSATVKSRLTTSVLTILDGAILRRSAIVGESTFESIKGDPVVEHRRDQSADSTTPRTSSSIRTTRVTPVKDAAEKTVIKLIKLPATWPMERRGGKG